MSAGTEARNAGQKLGGIRVYPNPVADKLYFQFPDPVLKKEVIIYNPLGQVLLARSTRASHVEIDVGNLMEQRFLIVWVLLGGKPGILK